ncbi:MAG: chemotaxis protein [Desulfuromonadales bacterium C00003068]|jgi:methyl-accepting chemotaxis protein|nr:MAG: chemotaxis protein [Desulfuromonadales bacterium C00003068]
MVAKKYKRKLLNFHVKHRLQIWLMIRIGGIIILTAIVSALVLYGYARHETVNSFYDAHIKIRRLSDLLIPVVLAGSAVSLISGTVLAIFLPQKLAGPLYRIEKDLDKVQQGDLTVRIHLRTSDTLHNFAQQINETINHLDQHLSHIQHLNDEMQQSSKSADNDLTQQLTQLNQHLSTIKTTYSNEQISKN